MSDLQVWASIATFIAGFIGVTKWIEKTLSATIKEQFREEFLKSISYLERNVSAALSEVSRKESLALSAHLEQRIAAVFADKLHQEFANRNMTLEQWQINSIQSFGQNLANIEQRLQQLERSGSEEASTG